MEATSAMHKILMGKTRDLTDMRFGRWVEFEGKRMTLTQWCKHLAIPYPTVNSRIHKQNLSPLKALGLVTLGDA